MSQGYNLTHYAQQSEVHYESGLQFLHSETKVLMHHGYNATLNRIRGRL